MLHRPDEPGRARVVGVRHSHEVRRREQADDTEAEGIASSRLMSAAEDDAYFGGDDGQQQMQQSSSLGGRVTMQGGAGGGPGSNNRQSMIMGGHQAKEQQKQWRLRQKSVARGLGGDCGGALSGNADLDAAIEQFGVHGGRLPGGRQVGPGLPPEAHGLGPSGGV